MGVRQVEIPEIGTVNLYKRRGNRSLRLTIGSAGEIRVSMPYWLPYKAGEQFALTRKQWIVANRQPEAPTLQNGAAIGKAHHLYFEPNPKAGKVSTFTRANEIRVHYPPNLEVRDESVQVAAQKACLRALRREAEVLLPQRLQVLAEHTGFTYKNVAVKQLKSRWGSCSSQKEIVLNLFLMQLPWRLIDYVLIHELTHTQVMRHGAPFWKEMARHLPNAKLLRKEIHEHRTVLEPKT